MKATLEATNEYTSVQGRECRIWRGTTENGIPIVNLVLMSVCTDPNFQKPYEREIGQLMQQPGQFVPLEQVEA